ncbi:MAG TPA: HD domain-containing phosphohydrolase [Thermoanaerobaculia bacterium]|nr:HD domain-containing phosphohydrolase [Thermoanaerobaculia bacterium]
MSKLGPLLNRVRLRHLIFLLLLVSGLIPLLAGSVFLTSQNIDLFETQEQTFLTRSAEALSEEIGTDLGTLEREVRQLGEGFLALPGPEAVDERLRMPGVDRYFGNFMLDNEGRLLQLQVLDLDGSGPSLGSGAPDTQVQRALREAFEEAGKTKRTTYRFVRRGNDNEPLAVAAVPIFTPQAPGEPKPAAPRLVLQVVERLDVLRRIGSREAQGDVAVFLIDTHGRVLWEQGADDDTARALGSSRLVDDFRRRPEILASEYELFAHGKRVRFLGRVSPIAETGWGVVVQKPLSAAYVAVRQILYTTFISSLLLVALSGIFAGFAAGRFSAPFTRFAQTTHEIAAGKFGHRVEVSGPGREVVELAEDFNRMSGHVQGYVEKLQAAAQANRDLFIGSIRAFAAAVDAKDPYTRGHSERVAAYSRTIAKTLGQSEEFQYRIWIAGVLHDVGKIGIEDRILKKGGVLTADEYEQMKLHPAIGEEILKPLEPLKEMLPAIRWHHEAWNGRGYPDGLKGEQIPLIARIVAVADTFDAITTNRPYQKAYSYEYAVETITKLTGARFDAKVVTAFLRAFQQGAIIVEPRDEEPVRVSA